MMTDLTLNSVPKYVDFGLAFVAGPGQKSNKLLGTIAYAAPELLLEEDYDREVDLWSLGVIIYCLCSGSLPFENVDQEENGRMIIQDKLKFRSPRWQSQSAESRDLVTSMLDKEVKSRARLE